ncbi:MAG TPA: DUF6599 family protein [Terriglobia bacterium]|jgi:hypothetical protein|nr:DUF6599 family protein [Terriglobia bacterium]
MKFVTLLSITLWAMLASAAAVAGSQRATMLNLATLPKWQLENRQSATLSDVRQFGVEPAVDAEYGVTRVEIRTYRRENQTLQAVVEKAPDPSSAYGLLTFYQNTLMKPEKGMKLVMVGPDQALLARGAFFARVMRPAKISDEDFHSALMAIAGEAPSADDMALLPPSLPPQGIIPGSLKYVLGPVAMQRALPSFPADLVGFQKGAELEAAQYEHAGGPLTLIFIDYPTNSIARECFGAMTQRLGINEKSGPDALYGKITGSFVLLVQDAPSKLVADHLMGRLTIEREVSWDQPPPGSTTVVQMLRLIVGNIVLVLLLIGMAALAGILLVVSRRLAAKWFPNSDWAQGYEGSIIRLNLK